MWQLSCGVVTYPQIHMCRYSHVRQKPLLLWRDQAFKIYWYFILKWMIWLVHCLKYSYHHSILVQLGDANLLALIENQPWMENFVNDKRECVKTQFMWFSVSPTQIVSWFQFCVPVRIFWWTSEMQFCFNFKPLALVLSCLLLKTVTT